VGSTMGLTVQVRGTTWSFAVPRGATYITGTSVDVTVTATHFQPGFSVGRATRTLTVDLEAPMATYTPPTSLRAGTAITEITPASVSADVPSTGGYAIKSSSPLPSGLSLNPDSGAITGTPTMA